jgi:internalin A
MPAAKVEWYISYAWGDDRTPEGRTRENIVDQIGAAAEADGQKIFRDESELRLGDSISSFMRRIGAADRIFVILSKIPAVSILHVRVKRDLAY